MAYMRSKHPDLYAIPRVTVVIPCYNSTATLERAYASVAAQTETNIDLIVVDDGSTDDIVTKFAVLRREYRLMARLVRLPRNGGLAAARNAGFKKAKAEWVVPLDADDEMEPEFIERCLDASRRGDVVYPNVVMVEEGRERSVSVRFDADTITERNTIACTALIRKALWKKLKGYDEEMRGFEDWEFWIRSVKAGARFVNADTSLRYHRSEGSMLDGDWQDEMREYVASKHPDLFRPKVTVVIPVWNQAQYLERCVESVMSQTVRVEVIVVDDGSPDNVKEVFGEIHRKHPSVTLVSQDNKGLPGARNAGFREATAEWVIPLDADDRLSSDDYIEKCLEMAGDGVGVVMTNGRSLSGRVTNSVVDLGRMRLENTMHACQMIRKSVWEEMGGYKLDFYKGYEDWEFWINCVENGVEFRKCEGVYLEIDDEHGGRGHDPEVPSAFLREEGRGEGSARGESAWVVCGHIVVQPVKDAEAGP
jgi:glycosyltransferase involved in cell wall biosynthesis